MSFNEKEIETNLCNKYNNERSEENVKAFKTENNNYVKLLRKVTFDCCQNINPGNLADGCVLWETVKPLRTAEVHISSFINLIDDQKVICKDSDFQEFFGKHYRTFRYLC